MNYFTVNIERFLINVGMTRAFFAQMTSYTVRYDVIYHCLPIFEDVGVWQPWMMMLLMMMMTIIVMMVVMLIWGCVSLLKSKIRSKIRIIRIFRWEKKRCIQKGIIVKCLKGFSWWEKKKRKETEEKITEVFSVIQFCAHSDPPYPFSALALQYWIANYFTCLKRWYLALKVLIHLKLKINRSPYFYRWA